jgi:tetratricopeptide (TPR) repeat protein
MNLIGWKCNEPPTTEFSEDTDSKLIFQKAQSWLVIVGESDLPEGLDTGLLNMKEGQTAYLFCHSKFALGEGTRKYHDCELPPNSNVLYQVTATQKVQDTSRLNPYFSIQKALTRKKIANDLYQFELLNLTPKEAADNQNEAAKLQALKLYRQAGRDMKDLLDGTYFNSVEQDHPQRKEVRQLMIDCYNNVVVVYMHCKEYQKALDAVEIAMKRDSKNLKAMVRNAKLHVLLASSEKKLKEADEAIKLAENAICYKDEAEEKELKKIRVQYRQRKKQITGQ